MVNLQLDTKQKLITALPIFLIGLGITGGCLIAGGACYEIPTWRLYSGIAFGGIVAIFIGFVGIVGLIKRIPYWSIIWIAISMIGFLVLINFASSLGPSPTVELVVLPISVLFGLYVFYQITKQDWQSAGLFGIGLSAALSLILFFVATNISHDKIKIGYYDILIGIFMSGLIYWYIQATNQTKVFVLIVFVIFNGLMIYIFDLSMQKLNEDSQLIYLISFSNGLLLSGILLHFAARLIRKLINKIKTGHNNKNGSLGG